MTKAGNEDVFITKLNSIGSALIYSTFLGGNLTELGYSIVLDASLNAYITGYTLSSNFDISNGVFQTSQAGGRDVFLTKLDLSGASSILKYTKKNSYNIWPNPSNGFFKLTFENTKLETLLIEVYSIEGILLFCRHLNNDKIINLDLSNNPSGIYVIKIKEGDINEEAHLIKL